MKHLNVGDLESEYIPIPPLSEQEKIAGILGTWDEAIEKLSSLIEQKKNFKKGLMQKLLTGKTRLKGFTQPWKEVKLGDMCKMFSGGTPLVSEEKYYKNGKLQTRNNTRRGGTGACDSARRRKRAQGCGQLRQHYAR